MKILNLVLSGAAIIPIMAGCASSHPTTQSAVGPSPAIHANSALGEDGRLQVYTAQEAHTDELTTVRYPGYSYPHTSYEIQNEAGATVKYVPNSASSMDESPDLVKLPRGTYTVLARSTSAGEVSVPVTIEPGKTTVVHLDGY